MEKGDSMKEKIIDVHVGRRLRQARSANCMNQESLGKKLGVSFQQIQKYEKGLNRISSSRLWEMSKILGTTIDYFFEGLEGYDKPQTQQDMPRRTIELARQINGIENEDVRDQILSLIRVCKRADYSRIN